MNAKQAVLDPDSAQVYLQYLHILAHTIETLPHQKLILKAVQVCDLMSKTKLS